MGGGGVIVGGIVDMGSVGTRVVPAATVWATTVSIVTMVGVGSEPPKRGKLQPARSKMEITKPIKIINLVFILTSGGIELFKQFAEWFTMKDIPILTRNQEACRR
jgi:hypothetical protein